MDKHNPMELMICVAIRLLNDNAVASVSTGTSCDVAILAQNILYKSNNYVRS